MEHYCKLKITCIKENLVCNEHVRQENIKNSEAYVLGMCHVQSLNGNSLGRKKINVMKKPGNPYGGRVIL